ncbi:hypothetical protein FE257_002388 [Aspergillus nanangensis]|uniref:Uncharacterized protein n=1 Tax=Aspergillus nanangensis TaxID=2582783 RepID=A0AAD4CCM3_ASPNN|nr:hypothetical protein FE257_002388 [Aspergillus nanangensis]
MTVLVVRNMKETAGNYVTVSIPHNTMPRNLAPPYGRETGGYKTQQERSTEEQRQVTQRIGRSITILMGVKLGAGLGTLDDQQKAPLHICAFHIVAMRTVALVMDINTNSTAPSTEISNFSKSLPLQLIFLENGHGITPDPTHKIDPAETRPPQS